MFFQSSECFSKQNVLLWKGPSHRSFHKKRGTALYMYIYIYIMYIIYIYIFFFIYILCGSFWRNVCINGQQHGPPKNQTFLQDSTSQKHRLIFSPLQKIDSDEPNWVFPKMGVPQNGWFVMENPIKMDDLGGKPTIFGNTQLDITISEKKSMHWPTAFCHDKTLLLLYESQASCRTWSLQNSGGHKGWNVGHIGSGYVCIYIYCILSILFFKKKSLRFETISYCY